MTNPDYEPLHRSSRTPVPKVAAATTAAALATVVIVVIEAITSADAPTGLEGALATLFAFGAGYLTPPHGV